MDITFSDQRQHRRRDVQCGECTRWVVVCYEGNRRVLTEDLAQISMCNLQSIPSFFDML